MAEVEVYASRYCPFSVWARRLLNRKGVDYTVHDVDRDPLVRSEMQARGGRHTVPQIFIDGQPIGGYDRLARMEDLGQLDSLLGLPTA